MDKKKLAATVALVVCLAGGAVWGGSKLLQKDWNDRRAELTEALSNNFVENGAPSKEVADKAAECVAEVLVTNAVVFECSAEGEVLKAMSDCVNAHDEMKMAFVMNAPVCIKNALGQ